MDSLVFYYILFWVCIFGLCLGSFYNVVILRSLSGESIVFPPSKCPKCGNKLLFWHNIPVLSYILLKGKCYFCKEKISIQYPLIEITTMLLFAASFIKFGISVKTIFAMILCSCLLIMTMTDLKEKLVDCWIAIGLGIFGLAYNIIVTGDWKTSLLGALVAIIVLETIARLGYLVRKSRALGDGDTYVAGALGTWFGLQNIGMVLIYSLIASMFVIVPLFLYNQFKKGHKLVCVVFVLFLIIAILNKIFLGNYLLISLLLITGITLSTIILHSLKKDSTPMILPFVPAFAVGALVFLFLN